MRLFFKSPFVMLDDSILQAGKYRLVYQASLVSITDSTGAQVILVPTIPSELLKENFTPYASFAEIETALSSYFISTPIEDPDFDELTARTIAASGAVTIGGALEASDTILASLILSGYFRNSKQAVTTSVAITKSNVLATGGSGGIAPILPTPLDGLVVRVTKVDAGAGAVTVTQHSAEKINGANTFALSSQYDSVTLISDGTSWFILAQNPANLSSVTLASSGLATLNSLLVTNLSRVGIQNVSTSAAITKSLVFATGGAEGISPTLPTPADGLVIEVIKVDAGLGAIEITPNATEKISGNDTCTLENQYSSARLRCDGTNWFIISKYEPV